MNLKEHLLNTPSKDKWKRIGLDKRSGVLIPLFSVYSKDSLGIGDLRDLMLAIDWCKKSGNSILQLLPMNELGAIFCPYDSLSSFALEPAYIALRDLGCAGRKGIKEKINSLKETFPCGRDHIDYGIKTGKIEVLRDIYLAEGRYDKDEFKGFVGKNAYWIDDFALFKALKDYHKGAPWYEWEEQYKNRLQSALADFSARYEKEVVFQKWVQWQIYNQFKAAKEYAASKKILLKGDLPILVSRDSADVWAHPDFFKLEFAAGAPPDMYCAKGQRWGMPTYNWQVIAQDGYRYLKAKLKYAEEFYDILRIDHVVGLFRIWSIPYAGPLENKGLNGFFEPGDESRWGEQGRQILAVILENTNMLLCAEDLGVIPKVCTETLAEFGIPGNDVQRWVKDWKIKHDFLPPKDYRPLSVAMLSTHDTTNWAAWWENEAGTVDEGLFIRKCADRKIDYNYIKEKLFNLEFSRYGRLRWLDNVNSQDKLVIILNEGLSPKGTVPKEHLLDFIDLYKNTYQEKEKLWKYLSLEGPMREKCDANIMAAILKVTLGSAAIFSIEFIVDWLGVGDIFKGDHYQYRINTPGTISRKNWSFIIPIALDSLLRCEVTEKIRNMIRASGRI